MWWMVDVGFSHVLDEENLTQAQEKCLDLDAQAIDIIFRSFDDSVFEEIMNMKTAHEIWSYLNEKYGMVSDDYDEDDDPKEEAHEDVEHDHNMVVVEDCSTSWSSDDDDQFTISSLDKDGDDASSVTSDVSTPSTLDGDESSCSGLDDATTSPSTTSHCFMSLGDTKVSNDNVIDHVDSYDELVSRLASMNMPLENEKAKTMKLEK
jgi:hypothetical protein